MTESEPPPRSEWDDHADGWDQNEDARLYAAKAFSILKSKVTPRFEDPAAIRVLDFGCGTGLLSEWIAAICGDVVAVDSSPKMIEMLRAKLARKSIGNITAVAATIDAQSIKRRPELAGPFDLIVASSVCSFLPDYERTMRDLSTLLKPAGFFVQWDWMSADPGAEFGMPMNRVRKAYAATRLIEISIEEAFSIDGPDGPMPVLMGVACRSPV